MNPKIARIITAALFIVLGVMFLMHPGTFSNALYIVIGIAAAVYGIVNILNYLKSKDMMALILGIVFIAIAIIFFIKPAFLVKSANIILAVLIILIGLSILKEGFGYDGIYKIISIAIGVLAVVFGVLSLFGNSTASWISIVLGIAFIIIGVRELYAMIKG